MPLHHKPTIKENHHTASKIGKKKKKNTYANDEEAFLSKDKLIKQIDTELKHLKGRQNILQKRKEAKTWTNPLLLTNLKNKKIRNQRMSADQHKIKCNTRFEQVCKDLEKLLEKNCVKVTDSSTQIGSSFYHLNSSEKDIGQYSKEIEKNTKSLKNMNFGHSEHFISSDTLVNTGSNMRKNVVLIRNVSPTTQSYKHKNYSTRLSGVKTKTPSPVQPSSRPQPIQRTCYTVSNFLSRTENRTRSPDIKTFHPYQNNRTKDYNAQQEVKSGQNVNRKHKNMTEFLFEQKTPNNNLRTKRNISSSLSSPKRNRITQRRTLSSTRRHAQLSKEISDYASRLTDDRASRKSDKQSTYRTKKSNREVSTEVYKQILKSKKQAHTPPSEVSKISGNVSPSYNNSKTKMKFEKNLAIHHKHNTFIIMNRSQSISYNKKGKQSHPTKSFESCNNKNQKDNSRTNNISQTLSSTKLHYPNVIKPNVIDDTTYVCPDNSEENGYLILPYINTTMSEDNVYLNLSPKPAIENLANRDPFPKENKKSAVILEDISSHESQVYCSINLRSRTYSSHHEPPIRDSNGLTQNDENKKNPEEILSQYDKCDYMSHIFEKTWDSHTNYRHPRSSKFETSHDLRIQTSTYHRPPYYNPNDISLETSLKRSFKKRSITISPEKDEMRWEYQRSKMMHDSISNKLRSHQYDPKEKQFVDQESDKLAFKNRKHQEDMPLKSDLRTSSEINGYMVTKEHLLDIDSSLSDTGKVNHFHKGNQASTSSVVANDILTKSRSNHDKSDLRTNSETREQKRSGYKVTSDQLFDTDSSLTNAAKEHRLQTYKVSQAYTRSDFENVVLTKPLSNHVKLELKAITSYEPEKLSLTTSRKYDLLESKKHSSQSTDSSNEFSVKSVLLTKQNDLNLELMQDLKGNDFKAPLSLTKQVTELGAISKKDSRSKSIVSVNNNQRYSIQNEKFNTSSDFESYESRKIESESGMISKERTALSSPKLNQSKRNSKKHESISLNGLLLGAVLTPSLEKQSVRDIDHDTENSFKSSNSSEKSTLNLSRTPQSKFTYSSNELQEHDSKQYTLVARHSVSKENIPLAESKHKLQEQSPPQNEEHYLKKNPLQNSQLQMIPKIDSFSLPTEWQENKNNDLLPKAICSDLNASPNFDHKELLLEKISKSKLSDPKLGAISRLSYVEKDLDLDLVSIDNISSFSLPTQPKVLQTREISRKAAQSEPTLNTSTSEMLLKIEPNESFESNYNTNVDVLKSSDQYEMKNCFKSKKLSEDDISILNNEKEPSESKEIYTKAVSQRCLPATDKSSRSQSSESFWTEKSTKDNSFIKSTLTFHQKLKTSISQRYSSELTHQKENPIMEANFPSRSNSFSDSNINLEKEVPGENDFKKKYSKSSGHIDIVNQIEEREHKMADLSLQSEKEWPSFSGVVQKSTSQIPSNDLQLKSSNEFESLDKSSLRMDKSNNSFKKTKSAENAFLSDTFNQNVPIEGVPLEVSDLIQHLQNRLRDCDENVKKQLREFEIQKKNCQTAVKECKSDSSHHIQEDDEWESANVKNEALEEFAVSSESNSCDKIVKEDLSESEIEGEVSCHCIFCGEEQSTSFGSEEIPSFKGCDCMRENYYGIMRIAYKK